MRCAIFPCYCLEGIAATNKVEAACRGMVEKGLNCFEEKSNKVAFFDKQDWNLHICHIPEFGRDIKDSYLVKDIKIGPHNFMYVCLGYRDQSTQRTKQADFIELMHKHGISIVPMEDLFPDQGIRNWSDEIWSVGL